MKIEDILNKRYATRSMSDKDFETNLQTFADQLTSVDYKPSYEEPALHKDWKALCKFNCSGMKTINSTSRIGMKLCEHFFPNFWDIKSKKHGSFNDKWQDTELLKKVLIWNRKCHSTPYLSELKRGIYFCSGMTKSTMYRPQLAKCVTYGAKTVFDPCAGWGGRLLGSVANGAKYYAFEPNTKTFDNLNRMVDFLDIRDHVQLINDDVLNIKEYDLPPMDICITSPPYFDLEIYTDEETQSINNTKTYSDWVDNFLAPTINNCIELLTDSGVSCWNVAKCGKDDMWEDTIRVHNENNFYQTDEFIISSSRRQANQNSSKNQKSTDKTIVFSRPA